MAKREQHIFLNGECYDATLDKTVEMMVNGDYEAQLVAEYRQLTTRINRLQKHKVSEYKYNKNDGAEKTAVNMLYICQLRIMRDYQDILKRRAEIEGIDLKM